MKIFLCIILFILFTIWTTLLLKAKLIKIDEKVYNKISFNNKKTTFFRIITNLASTIYFIILCTIIILLLPNKKLAFVISMAMIIDAIIIFIIKHLIKRERPNIKRLVQEKGYSYPSGHTFSATCFYGLIIFLTWTNPLSLIIQILITILLIMLVLIIAISRIYLGVHYFSDTVGAILISTSYLLLYVYIMSDILKFL